MQNKKLLLQLAFFSGLLIALCLVFYFFYRGADAPYATTSKILRFNYTLSNTSGNFIPSVNFSIKIPMSIGAIQNLVSINSSFKNELLQENNGEQSVHFSIDNISPYSSKVVDLTLVVNISDRPKYEHVSAADYLVAEKYIELDSPAVKSLAAQLKRSSSEETARNIYEWLVNNTTSSSYTADSKGAQYLIEKKSGDCTELMFAFVALARANGIPARGISGFWVPAESTIINAADYHDWAEFYDGERWVLVDPFRHLFNEKDTKYIEISIFNMNGEPRFIVGSESLTVAH